MTLFNKFAFTVTFLYPNYPPKTMNSVQQQSEHHHLKVLIQSFHLSGHTTVVQQSRNRFRSFLGLIKFAFGSDRDK